MTKSRKRQDDRTTSAPAIEAPDQQPESSINPERISMRAYELYLARGAADGQAWDDWLEAERELAQSVPGSRGDRHE